MRKTKTVKNRNWAWHQYRTQRLKQDGGTHALTCNICGTTTPTGGWHLDHHPHSYKDLTTMFPQGLTYNELDQLTRWLCRTCNLRKGQNKTDKQVAQLNKRKQKPQTTIQTNKHNNQQTPTKTDSNWQLTPKRKNKQ